MNLKTIIEKAISLHHKKIYLRTDYFFKLEGNIKNIFYCKNTETAMLLLNISDTLNAQSA